MAMPSGMPPESGDAPVSPAAYVRDPRDFFRTPPAAVRAIVPHLQRCDLVLDAGAGDGAIGGLLVREDAFSEVDGIELDPELAAKAAALSVLYKVRCGDFLQSTYSYDLIISNPPFKLAFEFVEHALRLAEHRRGTVAMLLRLAFLETPRRGVLHRANPSDVFVFPSRPSFTGDGGTDRNAVAWFVWGPGRGGRWQILDVPEPT